ncbi:hypothetical protein FGO68_gene17641 [Halteria grandinella]|uniref:Protein kinase domain-containing protein n=1 Tax=Halteria grandinella TaxID=5974 RepID=A0A8J8NMV6_HALGN|nr:hypothetical protein FGO68_gene17641 [Halteria grandinella]
MRCQFVHQVLKVDDEIHKNFVNISEPIIQAKFFRVQRDSITQTENRTIIVSDFHHPPNLCDIISLLHFSNVGMSEDLTKYLLKQLLEALNFLHSRGAAHLNIKPDNIYLDDNCNIILSNYENSMIVPSNGIITSRACKNQYSPPEVINCNCDNCPYDAFKRDIYQMGAVFFSAITGTFHGIYKQMPDWNGQNKKFTPELQDLIERMLSYYPHDRPSADELLQHPWFNLTTHPCTSKIQLGILEFSEFAVYLRDQSVDDMYVWNYSEELQADIKKHDFIAEPDNQ